VVETAATVGSAGRVRPALARDPRDLIVGVSPLYRPDPVLVLALVRAGALGVLDLGSDTDRARAALDEVEDSAAAPYGARISSACQIEPDALPAGVDTVVVADHTEVSKWGDGGRLRVLVEVRSLDDALLAAAAGASGLIARGSEGGGLVGEETAFILLQQLVGSLDLPVWVAGGIGVHSAAGAIAAGARGVVLDTQLALLRESSLPAEVKAAIKTLDGSETVVVGGHRIFTRPDLPSGTLPADTPPAEVAARLGGDDLRANLLPIGQEGAFATGFASRWPAAGALVRGLRKQIDEHLRTAQRVDPLAPGSSLAASLGVRYPIAQGPMTRVSDRARFAEAVAAGGGLPFLALSLMSGPESAALLEETSQLLDGRPFGAGILGFVPADVRAAQLEAIKRVRPPVALIAGGRPSQARPLEELGIKTYLHVPSPGLLERFVRDGARRFVFEGRECGGHVGPRSSFALWDVQVEALLASGHAGEVSVLFAGGVHDARSAAAVAAIAAPLAAAGAEVGVLMGTAYLFTEEAVATGAIKRSFQQAAVDCRQTVLLETAPGHSTRCADSGYVRAFAAERSRLQSTGTDAQEMWAALEVLNLGRLRIASKGIVREGDALVEVGEEAQVQEGMFMLGQAAALRSESGTVAGLHDEVSRGGSELLADVDTSALGEDRQRSAAAAGDVAIVGMACVFPGAADADEFWANLVAGRDAITEVPIERWDPALYYDKDSVLDGAGRKTPSKWGGFIPAVGFDALAYGIPPRSLAAIEPVQLLSLDVARQALDDAGYGRDSKRDLDRSRVSVVFGAEAGTDLASAYGFRALAPHYLGELTSELDEGLPELTEDSFPGLLTNVIAGRIANRLDLGGVNYTVDAACASSLAAVDVAMKELRSGTSDMVLCGGADLHNGINDYLLFAATHALSPQGRCASFDASADGIALGEGVGCVVLKRLEDAERDGDRVYAVLKAVAGSSDGRSLGLTAPRPEGQRVALERAYEQSGISPSEIGLLEAHGTGTVVGDRTELGVLTELYRDAGAEPASCALGSVKSQIGHTKCAAGLAGLIKVARSLYHGVVPPTIHIENPNPGYDSGESPFRFQSEARPWLEEERAAGISAFGFGGTNFHAVVTSPAGADHRPPSHGLDEWPAELFLFRADTRDALMPLVEQVRARAKAAAAGPAGGDSERLRDLAAAVCTAGSGPVQLAVVATSFDDLADKLDGEGRTGVYAGTAPAAPPEVAFLFPGQGSQRPGMLSELFVAFPFLREELARHPEVARVMLPAAAFGAEDRKAQLEAITDTSVAQPALGIAGLAGYSVLRAAGVEPAMMGGHSYGEVVALAAAGALAREDLVALSVARAEEILAAAGADPGSMAAVAAGSAEVLAVLGEDSGVVVANDNAPRQVVVSGPTAELARACDVLATAGLAVRRIPVACAFHSPVVSGAAEGFAKRLADLDVAPPAVPVWSNTTGAPYPTDPELLRAQLAGQLAAPVHFRTQVEAMYGAGARIFVEAGPGTVLSGLVGKILGDRPHRAIGLESGGRGVEGYLHLLAALAAEGVEVDPTMLFSERATPTDLSSDPTPAPGWVVNGHAIRTAAGEMVTGGGRKVAAVAQSPGRNAQSNRGDGRTDAVVEYLRGMRETVAATRDVMLAYLGVAPVQGQFMTVPLAAAPAPAPLPQAAAAAPAPAAPQPASWTRESLAQLVLAVVSDRTGYPTETLEGKLDLEADLSIDSIKRLEIVGEIADRVGLGAEMDGGDVDDELTEELVRLKTIDAIVDWLFTATSSTLPLASRAESAEPPAPTADRAAGVPPSSTRLVPTLVRAAGVGENRRSLVAGTSVVVSDDEGSAVAAALESLLCQLDGDLVVRRVFGADALGSADVYVHLAALGARPGNRSRALFERVQEAVRAGSTAVLAVTAMDGRLGMGDLPDATGTARVAEALETGALRFAGMRGVMKTVGREVAGVTSRLVDLDPSMDPGEMAQAILEELLASDALVEVGRRNDERTTMHVVEEVEEPIAGEGGPAVDPEAVVLVTGGARGVTAKVAVELARLWGCRLVLAGRSELPNREEDRSVAEAADAQSLRRLLAGSGFGAPAEIEAEVRRILGAREIRSTLALLGPLCTSVEYRRVDVSDPEATAALMRDVRAFYGRLDGVVHGAGVIEDARLVDKTSESFERVFSPKVAGAAALADAMDDETRFAIFFSSVSGVFGNRGQVDYAAANDALAAIARHLDAHLPARVVAIDWGPFGGGGMVSPELERELGRRGVGLLEIDDAVTRLLGELSSGAREPEVIVMRAQPESFGWHADLCVAAEHSPAGANGSELGSTAGAAQISDG
jgi:acyl transferase domain-containing protein/NAD(P)H-dependent flavin oxidoreductase YrpB (nitropropane dioxygenase family)/NAD(P)-dependent dehydrogenase (short-subunit alcohol dehydrogenase family)